MCYAPSLIEPTRAERHEPTLRSATDWPPLNLNYAPCAVPGAVTATGHGLKYSFGANLICNAFESSHCRRAAMRPLDPICGGTAEFPLLV
jgi:hypothetical protein